MVTTSFFRTKRSDLAISIAITAVCLLVYSHCLFFGITNADDEVMITGNLPFLRNFANIFRVFSLDAFYASQSIDLYRPLQSLTYILDAQWGRDVVFNAHLTNLLLHIGTCLIVYRLLLHLQFQEIFALLGALVYAVHYNFMTAVAWLPARGDLLLALFSFLSLAALIRSVDTGAWRNIAGHLGFFTLALFSKESAVVLPLLYGAYLLTYRCGGSLTRRHVILPFCYVAIGSWYWLLKEGAVAGSADERGFGPFIKNLRTLPETVAKFYLPVNISTLPDYQISATLAGFFVIFALFAIHFYLRKRLNLRTLFYPLWFLFFILPGMTYYPNFYSFGHDHVDHRSYVICFGLLLMTLYLLQQADLQQSKLFAPLVIMILAYLTCMNIYFSRSYRNPAEFARRAIVTNSNSALAFSNYGIEKVKAGDDLEGLWYLNRSLQICDKFLPALHYRARIFRGRGMNAAALADLNTLLSADPSYDAADYMLRGTIKTELHDDAGARSDFDAARMLDPNQAEGSSAW